jgi:hypothetical protein
MTRNRNMALFERGPGLGPLSLKTGPLQHHRRLKLTNSEQRAPYPILQEEGRLGRLSGALAQDQQPEQADKRPEAEGS